ncbi:hypothetical protein [Desulfomonile tiedjei]|uniref:hypothetical protein n=1 Tax=Desulfomonile tiedjei TaxID=2358 RepID=UPI0012F7FA93|nr:hypothetical protein [Desulfomonile tiedjei]
MFESDPDFSVMPIWIGFGQLCKTINFSQNVTLHETTFRKRMGSIIQRRRQKVNPEVMKEQFGFVLSAKAIKEDFVVPKKL